MTHLSYKHPFLLLDNIRVDGMPISVVRDDVFPFVGGGNKARKAVYYEDFLRNNNYNAVVTCGGVQSNHNRAIALMAARNGWKCHPSTRRSIQPDCPQLYQRNKPCLIE